MKKMYLIAGVNGAGKSSIYLSDEIDEIEEIKKTIRINTDEIVKTFGDWQNQQDQIKAGREAIKLRRDCFENGNSFNEETTFCGKTILKQIEKAKKLGYKTYLYYVGVNSPEISKERIKYRVSKGGHNISNEIVEQRYYESLKNLRENIDKFDYIKIYDNSENFKLCYSYSSDKELQYINEKLPDWLNSIVDYHIEKISSIEFKKIFISNDYNIINIKMNEIENNLSYLSKIDIKKNEKIFLNKMSEIFEIKEFLEKNNCLDREKFFDKMDTFFSQKTKYMYFLPNYMKKHNFPNEYIRHFKEKFEDEISKSKILIKKLKNKQKQNVKEDNGEIDFC